MKYRLISNITPIKLLFFFLLAQFNFYAQEIKEGHLDLSSFSFEESDKTYLDGKWEFYWEQLSTPEELTNAVPEGYAMVPGFWKYIKWQKFPAQGYATYKLTIELPENHPLLGLRLSNIHNNYNLWVNGELKQTIGEVGKDKANSTPRWLPVVIPLHVEGTKLEIVMQISNFDHRNGGIQDPITLGALDYLLQEREAIQFGDLFLGGSLLVIGLFFIGMFFFWKKDKSALHFGLFSIAFSARVLIVSSRALVILFPWMPWEVTTRIEYLSIFLSMFFLFNFFYYVFQKQTAKWIVNFVRYYSLSACAFILIVPATIYSYVVIPNNFILLGIFIYANVVFVIALRQKVYEARWAIIGVSLFLITTFFVLLDYNQIIFADPLLISLGYLSFVFSMSLIFASRFGNAFMNVERLKQNAEEQNIKITEQKEVLLEQNNLINDSIEYAERIQSAILPGKQTILNQLPGSFLFFKPLSTVSGDFYWSKKLNDTGEVIMVVADCTGHGVPGAFMSILGMSSLDKIVSKGIINPSDILRELNEEIRAKLKIDQHNSDVNDGMDIIVCKINPQTNEVRFSSAHHKLVYIDKAGVATLMKGDKHFIGNELGEGFEFKENHLQLNVGEAIYLFSDGIYDQKGGERGKRLYYKGFEQWLVEVHELPRGEEAQSLSNKLQNWIGDCERLDDMIVFGWKP